MAASDDPPSRYVTETPEEVDAFWDAREPVMAVQQAATASLAPAIIGLTVDQASRLVADEAARAGVPLTLQIAGDRPITAMAVYGRVTAYVRDGLIYYAEGA